MTLIQRTRFADILKILTGWRGVSPGGELLENIQPSIEVAAFDPLTDDGTGYWCSLSQTVAAVAANFSAFGVMLSPTAKPGTRAVVDGFYTRFGAPNAAVINVGLSTAPQGGAANPTQLQNNFLATRDPVTPALSQVFNAVQTITRSNSPNSVFGTFAGSTQNGFDNTAGVFQAPPTRNPLAWLLTPGWGFWIEASAVNTQVSGFCWGRYQGDQT